MNKVYMLPVIQSGLEKEIMMTIDGRNQVFTVPEDAGQQLPIKISDTDNDGVRWATAHSFVC